MKHTRFLILQIVVILFTVQGFSIEKPKGLNKEKVNVTVKASKKKIGVDQSDFMPSANSFGFVTSYSLWLNQLQDEKSKTIYHRFAGALTYSFDKKLSSYASMTLQHETYENKIYKENDTDRFHQLSNMNLGLVYSFTEPFRYVQRSSTTFNIGLPISEKSQADKHVANVSLINFIQGYSWNGLSLFNRLSASYLWNTLRFSLFDNDQLNSDLLLSNSMGFTYMPIDWLGFRFNYQFDSLRYLDSTWNLTFGTNTSIFANVSGFQIFASLVSDSYPENSRLEMTYYDKYKKIFFTGVTYAF